MNSFGQFIDAIERAANVSALGHAEMSEMIGAAVVTQAREMIGHDQPGWAQLADSTIKNKAGRNAGMGGDPSSILYDSGAFYNDITATPAPQGVQVGTNQEYIAFTEYGTARMPPRPVFPTATAKALELVLNAANVRQFFLRGL